MGSIGTDNDGDYTYQRVDQIDENDFSDTEQLRIMALVANYVTKESDTTNLYIATKGKNKAFISLNDDFNVRVEALGSNGGHIARELLIKAAYLAKEHDKNLWWYATSQSMKYYINKLGLSEYVDSGNNFKVSKKRLNEFLKKLKL